jgi:hypothetical protein
VGRGRAGSGEVIIPDAEGLLRHLRAIEPSEDARHLRDCLAEVAAAGAHPNPRAAANWILRRIFRQIDQFRSFKMREWRQTRSFKAFTQRPSVQRPNREWAEALVIAEMRRIDPKLREPLNEVGCLAVDYLTGSSRKGPRWRTHPIQSAAANLADSITRDWFPPNSAGRPRGAFLNTHFPSGLLTDHEGRPFLGEDAKPMTEVKVHNIRLTHEDLVEAALPSIFILSARVRGLTDQIKAVLAELVSVLNRRTDRRYRFSEADVDTATSSIEEAAKQYLRWQGPVARFAAENARVESDYLNKIAREPQVPIEIIEKYIADRA